MAGAIAQKGNEVLDIAQILGQLAPLFTSKDSKVTTSKQESQAATIDPAVLAQGNALFDTLMQRANSTSQADALVADIMHRATLAFSPILGEEKGAGVYNSTTKKLLANEAMARATAAAGQAVLQSQENALQQATSLVNQRTAATRTVNSNDTVTQTQRQPAAISGSSAATGLGALLTIPKLINMITGEDPIKKVREMITGKKSQIPDRSPSTIPEDEEALLERFEEMFGGNSTGGAGSPALSSETVQEFFTSGAVDSSGSLINQGMNVDILSATTPEGVGANMFDTFGTQASNFLTELFTGTEAAIEASQLGNAPGILEEGARIEQISAEDVGSLIPAGAGYVESGGMAATDAIISDIWGADAVSAGATAAAVGGFEAAGGVAAADTVISGILGADAVGAGAAAGAGAGTGAGFGAMLGPATALIPVFMGIADMIRGNSGSWKNFDILPEDQVTQEMLDGLLEPGTELGEFEEVARNRLTGQLQVFEPDAVTRASLREAEEYSGGND